MKQIITIIAIILTSLSCKAQTVVEPYYRSKNYGNEGVYYKDMDNDFNFFEGTWLYTNGSTSLTVKLVKKEMLHVVIDTSLFQDNYYTDALIGEYKYIEEGVEIINTLPNLDINYTDPYDYNITGGSISKPGDPLCSDCGLNGRRVYCSFSDPLRDVKGSEPRFIMRYFTENGIEKIKVVFRGGGMLHGDSPYTSFSLPYGEYILTKVE